MQENTGHEYTEEEIDRLISEYQNNPQHDLSEF
jgi:hypothetical protein